MDAWPGNSKCVEGVSILKTGRAVGATFLCQVVQVFIQPYIPDFLKRFYGIRETRLALFFWVIQRFRVSYFVPSTMEKLTTDQKGVITKLSSICICAKLLDVGVSGADLEKADRETLKNWYAEHWVAGKLDPAPVLHVPKGHDLEIEKTKLNLKERELKARKEDIQLRVAEKRQQVLRSLR